MRRQPQILNGGGFVEVTAFIYSSKIKKNYHMVTGSFFDPEPIGLANVMRSTISTRGIFSTLPHSNRTRIYLEVR